MQLQLDQLRELCERYPVSIPIRQLSAFLHVSETAIRNSMKAGVCPFGFACSLGDRSSFKVPTISFYCWMTKGALPLDW